MAIILNGTTGITTPAVSSTGGVGVGSVVTFPDNSTQATAATGFGFKNRIINGAMVIDQRNAGASVAMTGGIYITDRWRSYASVASKLTAQQSSTSSTGFVNSLLFTSQSAYTQSATDEFLIEQRIEGPNVSDLAWGTANAASITISFQVRCSVTGTFSGSVSNSSQDRNYPFTFSINSANTFETKSVTIAGDTSGTWLTTNGIGIRVKFNLGTGSTYLQTAGAWTSSYANGATGSVALVNTNGATFYITGVQLEKGSTATSFDYRPYGTELALCQRYYYKVSGDTKWFGIGYVIDSTRAQGITTFPVTMRTSPSAVEQTGIAANYGVLTGTTSTTCSSVPTFNAGTSEFSAATLFTVASGLTASQSIVLRSLAASVYLAWSAEL